MKFEYKTGDLLAVPSGHIVHGCNAQGAMGAGVALAIRNKCLTCFGCTPTRIAQMGCIWAMYCQLGYLLN